MAKLYLMSGVPGSGKSTWLQKHVEGKISSSIIISRDKIRFAYLSDDEDYFAHEKEVWREMIDEIVSALKFYDNVFVDATHLNTKSRKKKESSE